MKIKIIAVDLQKEMSDTDIRDMRFCITIDDKPFPFGPAPHMNYQEAIKVSGLLREIEETILSPF